MNQVKVDGISPGIPLNIQRFDEMNLIFGVGYTFE